MKLNMKKGFDTVGSMLRPTFGLFLLGIVFLCVSCNKITPSGIEATTVRNLDSDYSVIEIRGPFAVESSAKNEDSQIVITSDSNLLPQIETFCIGETLVIRYKKHTSWKGDVNRAEIILPLRSRLKIVKVLDAGLYKCNEKLSFNEHFEAVAANASEIKLNSIAGKRIKVSLSGASEFSSEITSSVLTANLSGASSMTVSGEVTSCSATLSGASVLNGRDMADRISFKADSFSANLSGASQAYLFSDGEISGALSGASVIYYQGKAVTGSLSMSGASSVQKYF